MRRSWLVLFVVVAAAAILVPVGDAAAGTDDGLFNQTGAIHAGATVNLTVAGRGGVPGSGVGSVALNVTAVNPLGSGYITVWPAGQTQPNASNLNFVGGQTIPNMVIVPLGANGQISLFSSATVDLLVDVLGWFPTGSSFTGLTPARLMDTRGGPKLNGGGVSNLTVAGRGGVPGSGVGSVALNVTAVNPLGSGYITVWPGGQAQPNASNLNFVGGQTIPNMVIVPLGANGQISLFSSATVDLLVDMLGWFPTGSSFTGLTPARLMDTRGEPKLNGGGVSNLTVAGRGGVPGSGVGSVALNVTAVSPLGSGYITVWPGGQAQPNASNLNFVGGQTIPNMVIVPLGANGQISLFSSATVDLLVDVLGWFPTGSSFTGLTPARLMDTRVPPPPPGQSKIRVLSLDFIPLIDRGGSMQDWPIDTIQARQRLGVASPSSAPIDDFYGEYDFSLSQVRSRIGGTEPVVVDTLELGSRYRGSGTAALDYEIVHRAEFLKPIPLSPSRSYGGNPLPDYLRLLSDVDVCEWVDGQQVREVWIWSYQGVRKSGWESNLSFRGGDISNSDQDPTDLPLCGHSYTVYEYNYGRGPQQAVHNHMHQFERIFALINGGQPFSRFWSAASCGTTHRPPNSDHDYQYDSMTLATSDCEKWSMVGPQAGTGVNAQTWSRTVPNGDPELGFYVWWMQNVPGLQSSAISANWWAMIADLDEAYPRRNQF